MKSKSMKNEEKEDYHVQVLGSVLIVSFGVFSLFINPGDTSYNKVQGGLVLACFIVAVLGVYSGFPMQKIKTGLENVTKNCCYDEKFYMVVALNTIISVVVFITCVDFENIDHFEVKLGGALGVLLVTFLIRLIKGR